MNNRKVPDWLMNASDRIIKHMNADHSNSIISTLNAQHGIKDKNAKMEKLQVNGYFTFSNQRLNFYNLSKFVILLKNTRKNLLSMLKNIEVMNYS